MLRKHIYKWHRTCSLIIAIPVMLWAASGILHPIMTTIRPAVATQALALQPLDSTRIKISLQEALTKNNISNLHNVRFIHIDSNWFYQVQKTVAETPVYLSATNGKKLPNGDILYARYIAKQFLEGQPKPVQPAVQYASVNADMATMSMPDMAAHDCCDAATSAVLLNDKGSQVNDVSLVTSFNSEYKFINRLLPVYKVGFDRADGIRIYVETTQDRFAFAMDNKRATFDTIFGLLHTWEWMNALGNTKYFIMLLLTGTAFITTLMGLYIFFTTKTKKPNGNPLVKARTHHRWTSLSIALFTLMFTGSGAYHAFAKLSPDTTGQFFTSNHFLKDQASLDLKKLQSAAGKVLPITNISLANIGDNAYWQVYTQNNEPGAGVSNYNRKDLMKSMSAAAPSTTYIRTSDYQVLPDGEKIYAAALGAQFSKQDPAAVKNTVLVTKFADEYGFVNKRLPVWKIMYASNSNERYYVETCTGKLAARVNDKSLVEGYSFALLHKHEFMAWAGKPVKDFSTMFWAAAQIAMVMVGLVLYFKMKKRKRVTAA